MVWYFKSVSFWLSSLLTTAVQYDACTPLSYQLSPRFPIIWDFLMSNALSNQVIHRMFLKLHNSSSSFVFFVFWYFVGVSKQLFAPPPQLPCPVFFKSSDTTTSPSLSELSIIFILMARDGADFRCANNTH